jgi:hypothetical protein
MATRPALAKSDCSTFLITTSTVTITPSTCVDFSCLLLLTRCSTISTTVPETDTTTLSSSTTVITTFSAVATTTQLIVIEETPTVTVGGPIKRAASTIPSYASACSGAVRYSSACSCFGVLPSIATTTVTAPTSTATLTFTSSTIITSVVVQTISTSTTSTSTTTTSTTASISATAVIEVTAPFYLQVVSPAVGNGAFIQVEDQSENNHGQDASTVVSFVSNMADGTIFYLEEPSGALMNDQSVDGSKRAFQYNLGQIYDVNFATPNTLSDIQASVVSIACQIVAGRSGEVSNAKELVCTAQDGKSIFQDCPPDYTSEGRNILELVDTPNSSCTTVFLKLVAA